MIAKRVRAGRNETGMLAQVRWLSANADALAAAVPDPHTISLGICAIPALFMA